MTSQGKNERAPRKSLLLVHHISEHPTEDYFKLPMHSTDDLQELPGAFK
jgi:hypothetical protein